MTAIDAWVGARDGASLAAAWRALGAEALPAARHGATFTGAGVAHLASELLGWPLERVAWLGARLHELDANGAPKISFRAQRSTEGSFLENAFDVPGRLFETWELREDRAGGRGVQLVTVGYGADDGSRDGIGGGGIAARVFDVDAGVGASVFLSSPSAAIVCPGDARAALAKKARAALDLCAQSRTFRLPASTAHDLGVVTALAAAIGSAFDPALASSASWPQTITSDRTAKDPRGETLALRTLRREDAGRAVIVEEQIGGDRGYARAFFEGLPWGWTLNVSLETTARGGSGVLWFQLPDERAEAVLARLTAWPGATL